MRRGPLRPAAGDAVRSGVPKCAGGRGTAIGRTLAMRFLHPEVGWWALAAFAAVALLKWRVRWRYAAFTALVPLRRFPWRPSIARRAPFAVLAIAAALTSLAAMQPVIPYSQADVQSRGL